ncbi:hypothetical protein AQJ27_23785 [Streptomyces olivochromogenes]|nr:hypothetical protein AQJ27_23785 [Streptomyces olivochromogenes]
MVSGLPRTWWAARDPGLSSELSAQTTAVGDGRGLADVAFAPDSSRAMQSLRLPGRGRPTTTTRRVSASMTTWWLVEYR